MEKVTPEQDPEPVAVVPRSNTKGSTPPAQSVAVLVHAGTSLMSVMATIDSEVLVMEMPPVKG